jgi:hypothetical protein
MVSVAELATCFCAFAEMIETSPSIAMVVVPSPSIDRELSPVASDPLQAPSAMIFTVYPDPDVSSAVGVADASLVGDAVAVVVATHCHRPSQASVSMAWLPLRVTPQADWRPHR